MLAEIQGESDDIAAVELIEKVPTTHLFLHCNDHSCANLIELRMLPILYTTRDVMAQICYATVAVHFRLLRLFDVVLGTWIYKAR